ncbi:MAG TPA: hypothetical protein VGK52_03055 [Polyangia bacterium]
MHSRQGGRLALLLVLAASVAGACSKPKSFIVLTLRSADSTDIAGVMEVDVTVNQAPSLSKFLKYPPKDGKPFTINMVNTNDLSVSFTGGRSGPVDLSVAVKDASGCTIGFLGNISVSIREGDIASAAVALQAQPPDCSQTPDGGVDAGGDAFPGCDPVTPALACMSTQTCQVNCLTKKGECTAGGTGAPGSPCMMNKDCAPGSQCFDYSGTGCAVKICLRFCNDDKACPSGVADVGADGGASDGGGAEAGAASTGPRSVCQGLVPCGTALTAYHTCTFACDPRAKAAAAASSGCPSGLSCLVVGNMDQVDCACAESTRTGVDGDDCATGAQCAPGFICNEMGMNKKCRAVCRCDAQGTPAACTAPNECVTGKTCTALTNDTTFGVCL